MIQNLDLHAWLSTVSGICGLCHRDFLQETSRATCLPSPTASLLIDVRRSSGISGRSTLAFARSVSCQTVCMFEGAWTSEPFHGDEWLFSSVLLPSYEKGDLVIGRLYEAIKNVCQSPASNAIPKQRRGCGGGDSRNGKKAIY